LYSCWCIIWCVLNMDVDLDWSLLLLAWFIHVACVMVQVLLSTAMRCTSWCPNFPVHLYLVCQDKWFKERADSQHFQNWHVMFNNPC
jgi:hypothetical protein